MNFNEMFEKLNDRILYNFGRANDLFVIRAAWGPEEQYLIKEGILHK